MDSQQIRKKFTSKWSGLMDISQVHRDSLKRLSTSVLGLRQYLNDIVSDWCNMVIGFLQEIKELWDDPDNLKWYLERIDLTSDMQRNYIKTKLEIELPICSAKDLLKKAQKFKPNFKEETGGIFGDLNCTNKLYQEKQTAEHVRIYLSLLRKKTSHRQKSV